MKPRKLLMDQETLFQDESVFTPSHVPADYIHRDGQLEEIMLSLKPGLRGVNPINTLVYGPPGTGKTTAVKYAFKELSETSKKLMPVYINCEDYSTPYAVFARIYEAVHGISPPSTGKPLEDVKESIFTRLKKDNKAIIIALDELDRLAVERNIDRVLVDLLKAHASYGFDRIGVMGITIKDGIMADLDEKTRSVYNPTRINFPKYARNEIRDILANRSRYGFYDGALKEELLEDIVDKTYRSGDLRTGIDLMRRSALLAERDASREIMQEHIEEAFQALPDLHRKETADAISADEKLLLDMAKENPGESSGNLYKIFREKTGSGVKRFNEIIAKLERLNLIKAEYKQGVRGRSREIRPV
jgi:cell division control protein 6